MSAVPETKPAVTTEAGVVEPTPAPAEVVAADKPAEAVEPKVEETAAKVEEPKAAEGETALPVAPVEEKKEEKAEEPIYSGALGYKAPGLRNQFRFSKKYFWFGEEPVSVQSLSHYLRGEKAEVAHPTAAWSSQTGKGLLYFVKHANEKATPAGVLNLSEATDVSKDGTVAFFFKLHGHKHTFEAQTLKERNGWFIAVEKAIEEAKAAKEGIVSSEGYKDELAKLKKPTTAVAPTAAKEESTPKKSVDATAATAVKPAETEAAPAEAAAPATARTGSSSSSSSDEDKKKKKASKSKSRSVSRGKRSSIFGGLLGKNKAEEKAEEKKDKAEEKVEEKKEEKKTDDAPAAEGTTVVAPTAPVIPPVEETTKPAEESKIEEAVQDAATEAKKPEETKPEDKKVEEKPKPAKRASIFGSFVEKLKSPTHEKKEHEVAPAVPAKEPETAAAPKVEETPAPVVPAVETSVEGPKTEETKAAEKPATTPAKEKQHFSFGKFLGGAKEKVRSPSGEKAPELPKTEEPAKTEETAAAPAAATETAAVPAPVEPVPAVNGTEEKKAEEPKETTSPTTKPKRGSIFGNFGGSVKKEGDSEKPQGLKGLFRQASKAGKGKKEEKTPATPAKVDEAAEPKEETAEAAKVEEKKEETPAAPAAAEPAAIGDVVPEAVQVGQAPKSTPQVSASA